MSDRARVYTLSVHFCGELRMHTRTHARTLDEYVLRYLTLTGPFPSFLASNWRKKESSDPFCG